MDLRGRQKVWSHQLTFKCILLAFSQSRISAKKGVLYKRTIKVRVVCFQTASMGTLRLAMHTWRCPCFSEALEAMGQARLRALEGPCLISKKALQGSGTKAGESLDGANGSILAPR